MGTRADFYFGRGKDAEWLGSIAWDGHPNSIAKAITHANSEATFRGAVSEFLAGRDDATHVADGWPWPWNDSNTTDYAYAFDAGKVHGNCFGHGWFVASEAEPDDTPDQSPTAFPDMSKGAKPTLGKRSGVMVFTAK